jgi:transposase
MMRKQYSAAFKAKVVRELLKEEKTLAQLASEYEVHPTQLKNWRAIALEGLPGLFEKQDSTAQVRAAYEQQLTDLYAEIGKLTTQVNWLKKSIRAEQGGTSGLDRTGGRRASTHDAGGIAWHKPFELVLSATWAFGSRDPGEASH